MAIDVVFETHSTSEDNEAGVATGWLPGRLSATGREQAVELGGRRRDDVDMVFCSDLARAVETVEIAFGGSGIPVLLDWRLRECDYGDRNGAPAAEMHAHRHEHIEVPYPNGESWGQAVARVGWFVRDLAARFDGARVVVVGHVATRWGLAAAIDGAPLEALVAAPFEWQPGWEHRLPT